MTYHLPNILGKNKNEVISKFWNGEPFPYLVIDNFLESKHFQVLAQAAGNTSISPALTFDNEIQKGKEIFSNENSPELIKDIVSILSHPEFVKQLSTLTGVDSLRPLTDFNSEKKPFHYFHRMSEGGYLGSHVDHSSIDEDDVHILNCIFYISEDWDSSWGGDTVFSTSSV